MPEISPQEIKSLVKIGVQEAKLNILINDFKEGKKTTDENLTRIYELIRDFPNQISQCRDTLEEDIKNTYMTKPEGALLKKDIASIKWWIVSSVGGFSTATGIFLWATNVITIGVN